MGQVGLGFLALVFGLLAASVAWSRLRRWRALRAFGAATVARDLSLRVHLTGIRVWADLDSDGPSVVRADLAVGPRGVLVVSQAGVLLGPHGDGTLTDARSPAPRRLVLEGLGPEARGRFRFETLVDDAEAWAERLRAHLRPGADPSS